MSRIYTIGTSEKSLEEFIKLLRENGITEIIDVRRKNDSQLLGFSRMRDLRYILDLHNIKYVHALEFAPSENLLKKYRKSKNWEEYVTEFNSEMQRRNLKETIEKILNSNENIALLCSEGKPDKCHRRLVAEFLRKFRPELEIVHITKQSTPHPQTPQNDARSLQE